MYRALDRRLSESWSCHERNFEKGSRRQREVGLPHVREKEVEGTLKVTCLLQLKIPFAGVSLSSPALEA